MRQETLTTVKGGLNRLRTKGAALKDSLFELLNGFVTVERTIQVRPGTILDETLPSGTVGLVSFEGAFHVFASSAVGGLPSNYVLHILRLPDPARTVTKIHFAKPFLGILYISAEFDDGSVFHFWLRPGTTWVASTNYVFNFITEPAADNGFVYRALRNGNANPTWTEGAPRAVNDRVEPTTASEFYFEVTQIFGDKAISGVVEPDWADAVDGQLINENVDGANVPAVATPPGPRADRDIPDETDERYGKKRFREDQ